MKTLAFWAPSPNLNVMSVERAEPGWLVAVDSRDQAACPICGTKSNSRHSSYLRTLRDLSAQGAPLHVHARLTRWRCRNDQCDRRIFADRLPGLAAPFARRTARLDGIVRLSTRRGRLPYFARWRAARSAVKGSGKLRHSSTLKSCEAAKKLKRRSSPSLATMPAVRPPI